MKKIFTLLTLALMSIGSAWALNGTEKATATGTKDADLVGNSYTIAGTFIAGQGSGKTGDMPNNGVKLRTNKSGNTIVFTVNDGYTITDFLFDAAANDDGTITATTVTVDDAEANLLAESIDFKKTADGKITLTGITATKNITITFDNSAVVKNSQLNAYYEISWTAPDPTEPTGTKVTPTSKTLVIGKTTTLTGAVSPAGLYESQYEWVSSNPAVATVTEEGVVEAVSVGTAIISYQWKTDQSKDAFKASAEITVVEPFDGSKYTKVMTYDFTAMGDVDLTKGTSKVSVWNNANSKTNNAYYCTNTGLEYLAIQEYFGENKASCGYKIVDGEGLLMGSGAGRCAAIGGLKAGWIVEFNHDSGTSFYTKNAGEDDGAEKSVLLEEENHAIYQLAEDGFIGFELAKGKHITSIVVYTSETTVSTTITGAGYATFASAYNLDFSASGAEVYTAAISNNNVVLTKVANGIVPAYAGVILKGNGNVEASIIASASALTDNELVGVIKDYTTKGNYILVADGESVKFAEMNEGTLAAGKAYLPKPAESAPELTIVMAGTTGITNVETAGAEGAIYNLNGVRVVKPTKGLYIQNGKKFVVK